MDGDVLIVAPAAVARGVAPAPAGGKPSHVSDAQIVEAQASLIREKQAELEKQWAANTALANALLALSALTHEQNGEYRVDVDCVGVPAALVERMRGGFVRIDSLEDGGLHVTFRERQ